MLLPHMFVIMNELLSVLRHVALTCCILSLDDVTLSSSNKCYSKLLVDVVVFFFSNCNFKLQKVSLMAHETKQNGKISKLKKVLKKDWYSHYSLGFFFFIIDHL